MNATGFSVVTWVVHATWLQKGRNYQNNCEMAQEHHKIPEQKLKHRYSSGHFVQEEPNGAMHSFLFMQPCIEKQMGKCF